MAIARRGNGTAFVRTSRGYTQLPNLLDEAITHAPFTGTQLKVVRCVVGLTFGARRRAVAISLPRLATACGRKFSLGFRDQFAALVHHGVIIRVAPAAGRLPAIYALNTDFARWGVYSVGVGVLDRVFPLTSRLRPHGGHRG